jgi:hypothetical protein
VALDERTAELALRDARRVASMIREATTKTLHAGGDPMPLLAAMQRRLEQAMQPPSRDR